MVIPEEHKATIRALVEADPEVAQATCDIPHLAPELYLIPGGEHDELPYCGCFVGVYAWMQECKGGNDIPPYYEIPNAVSQHIGVYEDHVAEFAGWCNTPEKDHSAVRYAQSLLAHQE